MININKIYWFADQERLLITQDDFENSAQILEPSVSLQELEKYQNMHRNLNK